jgi:hypothetical protein
VATSSKNLWIATRVREAASRGNSGVLAVVIGLSLDLGALFKQQVDIQCWKACLQAEFDDGIASLIFISATLRYLMDTISEMPRKSLCWSEKLSQSVKHLKKVPPRLNLR